jgi:hypothetical protein
MRGSAHMCARTRRRRIHVGLLGFSRVSLVRPRAPSGREFGVKFGVRKPGSWGHPCDYLNFPYRSNYPESGRSCEANLLRCALSRRRTDTVPSTRVYLRFRRSRAHTTLNATLECLRSGRSTIQLGRTSSFETARWAGAALACSPRRASQYANDNGDPSQPCLRRLLLFYSPSLTSEQQAAPGVIEPGCKLLDAPTAFGDQHRIVLGAVH